MQKRKITKRQRKAMGRNAMVQSIWQSRYSETFHFSNSVMMGKNPYYVYDEHRAQWLKVLPGIPFVKVSK